LHRAFLLGCRGGTRSGLERKCTKEEEDDEPSHWRSDSERREQKVRRRMHERVVSIYERKRKKEKGGRKEELHLRPPLATSTERRRRARRLAMEVSFCWTAGRDVYTYKHALSILFRTLRLPSPSSLSEPSPSSRSCFCLLFFDPPAFPPELVDGAPAPPREALPPAPPRLGPATDPPDAGRVDELPAEEEDLYTMRSRGGTAEGRGREGGGGGGG